MTDPIAPEPTPAPAAPAYAPVAAGPTRTLSIVGFVLGLVAFVFGWTAIFGLLVGIAAIIVSVRAHKKEPTAPAWMWLIGLIAGIVGALSSLGFTIFWISVFAIGAASSTGLYGY